MPFRPAHFLSFLFVFISFFSSAQDVELITRYSYYTHESEATLIIFGKDVEQVSQIKDENGQNIPVVQNNADSRLATVSLEKMDVGTKLLTFQIYLQNGTTTKQSVEIIRLAPKPNEVKVDRLTGGLLVNDLPFFPFGFYTGSPVGDILIQEAYNAMNLVGVYQKNDEESLEDRKAYMDQCAALGIKVNYHVNGLVGKPHNNTGFLITEEEEKHREQMLRREIELFKDHPALLSWYMNDEPIGQGRPPELLETAYQMIKEIDPYHPVSVVFVVPSKADAFANTMDIAMTDPYPIPGDVSNVRDAMQQLQKHFKYKKAFWMVPQAFGGGEFWPREPTAAEIRAMTYLGIYEGAMGVKYFIRRQPNFFPKSRLAWNECTKMAHELSMMTPWLFSEKGKTILQTNNKNILAAAWKKGNSTIILAVNTKNQPAPFSLNLENIEFPGNGNLRLLFENRSIECDKSGFKDIIDGHGTRVYLLEIPPNEKEARIQKHNLFINPGFEICASPGVPQGCYAGSDQQPIYDGSTYF
ncbi:MAG: hypothetical protein GY705_12920, partial [Bacteroidetes bacterium]|nr:hypothetical protein [Bacteroidota bacterium]